MQKKKVLKIVGIIILLIVVLFATNIVRKLIIFNKIGNVLEKTANTENYYAEKYSFQGKTLNIVKSYNKDGNYLTKINIYGDNIGKRSLTVYEKDGEQVGIIESGNDKVALLHDNVVGGHVEFVNYRELEVSFWEKLFYAAKLKVENEKDSYVIEVDENFKVWIDKETGLIKRQINNETVVDSYYEFNNVTDDQIQRPDTADCRIEE